MNGDCGEFHVLNPKVHVDSTCAPIFEQVLLA